MRDVKHGLCMLCGDPAELLEARQEFVVCERCLAKEHNSDIAGDIGIATSFGCFAVIIIGVILGIMGGIAYLLGL